MQVSSWLADMRRQNEITACGDAVLRFPAFAVRWHPAEVADVHVRALRQRGWNGRR